MARIGASNLDVEGLWVASDRIEIPQDQWRNGPSFPHPFVAPHQNIPLKLFEKLRRSVEE